MKVLTWITVSDIIPVPQTKFEKIVEFFDKKTIFYRSQPLETTFNSLKQSGINGLELLVTKYTTEKNITEIKKIFYRYHMPVLSIHQPLSNNKPYSLNYAEKLCKIANTFSAQVIVLHSSTLGKKLIDKDFTNGLISLQQKYGIKFGIENMSKSLFTSNSFIYNGKDFSETVCNNNLGITFDITHLAQTGEDIIQFFIKNKKNIAHIHLSDYKKSWINKNIVPQIYSHLPLTKGNLPIRQFLNVLKRENYKGYVTLEINSGLNLLCNSAEILKQSNKLL